MLRGLYLTLVVHIVNSDIRSVWERLMIDQKWSLNIISGADYRAQLLISSGLMFIYLRFQRFHEATLNYFRRWADLKEPKRTKYSDYELYFGMSFQKDLFFPKNWLQYHSLFVNAFIEVSSFHCTNSKEMTSISNYLGFNYQSDKKSLKGILKRFKGFHACIHIHKDK